MSAIIERGVIGEELKSCCAQLYESDYAKLLLGDSYHPGGLELTEVLGEVLELTPQSRVLDVAAGKGTSAIHLAESFGCQVVGVDYGAANIKLANETAAERGVAQRVTFQVGDAEKLSFDPASFDAIICECAFCTFPNKAVAARGFARLLKPAGRIGLSDLTRTGDVPKELDTVLAWAACIADAQPLDSYVNFLTDAGFEVDCVEPYDDALTEMVNQIRMKLLSAEIAVGLKKLDLPNLNFVEAKQMASSALTAIRQGKLGYAVISAFRPAT